MNERRPIGRLPRRRVLLLTSLIAVPAVCLPGCGEHGAAKPATATSAPTGAPIDGGPSRAPDATHAASASAPAVEESKPIGAPDRDRAGFLSVTFKDLGGFAFDPLGIGMSAADLDPAVLAAGEKHEFKIPENVKALDGKKASITGYILPIQVDVYRNESKSFMLVRDRIFCCFGATAGYCDFIMVQMDEGKAAKIVKDVPATAFGVLSVGEEKDRSGIILNIYRMKCDDLTYAPSK